MFRTDEDYEDYGEFWELCRGHAVLRHCRSERMGALLRCATVFEDTVKTVCTTNCSWWNNKSMVSNLCRMFGDPCAGDGDSFTFPTPARLASVSQNDLKEAKLGFRARYISEFAQRLQPVAAIVQTRCTPRVRDVRNHLRE
jgi:N-glycosylase/DNA lyase